MIKYQGVADLNRLETLTKLGHARLFYTSIPKDFVDKKETQFDPEYMRSLFKTGYRAGVAGEWLQETPCHSCPGSQLGIQTHHIN